MLRDLVKQILRKCILVNAKSLAMPAIGTGKHKFPEDVVFRILKEEFQIFSASQRNLILKDIRMIVFATGPAAKQSSTPPQGNSSFQVPQTIHSAHTEGKSTSQISKSVCFKPLTTGEAKMIVKLHVFGRSKEEIDASFVEVNKFIMDHTKTKAVEDKKVFDVLVKNWPKIEKLAEYHDVKITCQKPSVALIEGVVTNVSDCKEDLLKLIDEFVKEQRRIKQSKYISKSVQWCYFDGSLSVEYDAKLNQLIETAYMEDDEEILQFTKSGDQHEIDFSIMTEKNQRSGFTRRIAREHRGETG